MGLLGAGCGAALGALLMLVIVYRADARRKSQALLDGAAAAEASVREMRIRVEELQRLHAETATSHRSLGEEMRRREQVELALAEAQKLEPVGQLSGGLAHDFNNILTVILSSARHAKGRSSASGEVRADLDAISEAASRAADLARRLAAFGRRQIVEPRVLGLEDLLAHLDKMLRPLVGEDVRIRFDLSSEPLRVFVDPGQLEQVVMNLVANARDAMPEGGTLRFETRAVTFSSDDVPIGSGLTAGNYVRAPGRRQRSGDGPRDLQAGARPLLHDQAAGAGEGAGARRPVTASSPRPRARSRWKASRVKGRRSASTCRAPPTSRAPQPSSGGRERTAATRPSWSWRTIRRSVGSWFARWPPRVTACSKPAAARRPWTWFDRGRPTSTCWSATW